MEQLCLIIASRKDMHRIEHIPVYHLGWISCIYSGNIQGNETVNIRMVPGVVLRVGYFIYFSAHLYPP
jgi:hypothetical protein